MPPLPADFIRHRVCKPICEKSLTLPSQVKRKCGLDVGQNYNLSKKEEAKVPQCPPEKEAAIIEALKHFQMIS